MSMKVAHGPDVIRVLQDAFQPVWVRATSRVVVFVDEGGGHPQLFTRLLQDWEATLRELEHRGEPILSPSTNLWHAVVYDRCDDVVGVVSQTARESTFRLVPQGDGWLADLTRWGLGDRSRVRFLLFDLIEDDRMVSELTGLSLAAVESLRAEGRLSAATSILAQTLVSLARGELARSVLCCVVTSADFGERLVEAVRREHAEMPSLLTAG